MTEQEVVREKIGMCQRANRRHGVLCSMVEQPPLACVYGYVYMLVGL